MRYPIPLDELMALKGRPAWFRHLRAVSRAMLGEEGLFLAVCNVAYQEPGDPAYCRVFWPHHEMALSYTDGWHITNTEIINFPAAAQPWADMRYLAIALTSQGPIQVRLPFTSPPPIQPKDSLRLPAHWLDLRLLT